MVPAPIEPEMKNKCCDHKKEIEKQQKIKVRKMLGKSRSTELGMGRVKR